MGLTVSSSPNNTSNVPASHGQDGWGSGLGVHGGNGAYITRGAPREFGGYSDWYRATNATPPTYKDPQTGQLMASYNPNRRQIGRQGGQFENRKGNSFEPLRIMWFDNPHGTSW